MRGDNMKAPAITVLLVVICAGCLASALLVCQPGELTGIAPSRASAQEPPARNGINVATLAAEVDRLKKIVPDQAHAMKDVDYHFTNLWFAGKAKNWPLADFYWKETVSHMKWAVRIIPVRKDNAGKEVKLDDILQSIENSPYMQMGEVLKQQDADKFETTYKYLLEACYSCHKASDKPYLRPQIPDRPATSIINFDPQASWPR
jgi:hypothetical protein